MPVLRYNGPWDVRELWGVMFPQGMSIVVDDPKLTGLYGCAGTVWKVNQVDDDRPTSLIVQLDNWVHRVSVRPDQVRRIDP